ncbi:MAG: RNA methyltransferase [Clostridia bacterium]|nr:RNA methyltransferase [Clostridia bacterium]
MIKVITSADNSIVKQVKKLKMKSERTALGLYVAEGKRIVADAIEAGVVKYVVTTFDTDIFPVTYRVKESIFEKISDTKSPQGVLAVCEMREATVPSVGDIVVCDGVSDPGNLGTIIRTAECSGFSAVVLINNCVDQYNGKTVRSTMGSLFRIPVAEMTVEEFLDLKGYTKAVTMLDGAVDIFTVKKPKGNVALVVGSEAFGVCEQVKNNADLPVKIPMSGKAESINAAVAAGIAMYAVKNWE